MWKMSMARSCQTFRGEWPRRGRPEPRLLEEPLGGVVHPAQRVVVDGHALDATVGGEHFGLGLDLLGRQDPAPRALGGEQRVAVQQPAVAGQMLHAVDLTAAGTEER